MKQIAVFVGFFVILLWAWRRVYLHIMRKDGRPLIAHLISFLLSLFPARFFVYALLSVYPFEGTEPVSETHRIMFCGLFVITMLGLIILTRKRNLPAKPAELENNAEEGASDTADSTQTSPDQAALLLQDDAKKETAPDTLSTEAAVASVLTDNPVDENKDTPKENPALTPSLESAEQTTPHKNSPDDPDRFL